MRRWLVRTALPYYYPDRKLPELTADEITSLTLAARQGSIEARNKLIEGKLKHALSIAAGLAWRFPGTANDLAELAPFYLVKCVDAFLRNLDHNNLDAYTTTYMYHTLRRAIFEDRVIRIPKATADRHIENGTYDSLNVSVENQQSTNDELVDLLVMRLSPRVAMRLVVNTDSTLDLWEMITNVLEDDEEHRILELRIIGCSDKEVAAAVDRSVSYVAKKRNKILHSIKMELANYG